MNRFYTKPVPVKKKTFKCGQAEVNSIVCLLAVYKFCNYQQAGKSVIKNNTTFAFSLKPNYF